MYSGNVLKPGLRPGIDTGRESWEEDPSEEAATELELEYTSAGGCCSKRGLEGQVGGRGAEAEVGRVRGARGAFCNGVTFIRSALERAHGKTSQKDPTWSDLHFGDRGGNVEDRLQEGDNGGSSSMRDNEAVN